MTQLEAHPAAEFFPLLEGQEYLAFKADIAVSGQLEPIWLCEDKILDGRNRYRACMELGITPTFHTYTGSSPIAFAWSLNGERRHLTNAQRSAIGVEMLPALQEEARKRRMAGLRRGTTPVTPRVGERKKLEAVEAAAKIVGASGTNIQYAKAVKQQDPELFQRIKRGEVNVAEAYRQVRDKPKTAPPRNQPKAVRIADIGRLAQEGNRSAQIAALLGISEEHVNALAGEASITLPDAVIGRRPKIKAHRVIEETVSTLEGLALGLHTISGQRFDCAADEAREWVKSIDASLRVIGKVRKYLRSCM
jgi:hypothetical protein